MLNTGVSAKSRGERYLRDAGGEADIMRGEGQTIWVRLMRMVMVMMVMMSMMVMVVTSMHKFQHLIGYFLGGDWSKTDRNPY